MAFLTSRRGAGIVTGGVSAVAAVGLLAGCGGSSGTTAASSTTAATPSAAAGSAQPQGGGGFGGIDAATQTKITACLKAAGITVPTARPSGAFGSGRPSGMPTNRPTSFPSGAAGAAGGPGGAGGGIYGSTAAQAALKACGITLPSRPAGGNGAPPSATASPQT